MMKFGFMAAVFGFLGGVALPIVIAIGLIYFKAEDEERLRVIRDWTSEQFALAHFPGKKLEDIKDDPVFKDLLDFADRTEWRDTAKNPYNKRVRKHFSNNLTWFFTRTGVLAMVDALRDDLKNFIRYRAHLDGSIPGPLASLKHSLPWPVARAGQIPLLMNFHKRVYRYGYTDEAHHGIDIHAPAGTPVMSIADGHIELIVPEPDAVDRFYVVVRSASGLVVKYKHIRLSRDVNSTGQEISKGFILGYIAPWPWQFNNYSWREDHFTHDGSWSNINADHLHLQVYYHPQLLTDPIENERLYDRWVGVSGFNPLLILSGLMNDAPAMQPELKDAHDVFHFAGIVLFLLGIVGAVKGFLPAWLATFAIWAGLASYVVSLAVMRLSSKI